MPLTFFTWILAFLPVLAVLVLMLGFGWGGSRAGAVSWFAALIGTALLLFHAAAEAGALTSIGRALTALTPDRMMQGLLLGWLFASFLQGLGGFGVPVAVAAPLLVSLGFSPVTAVVMACVGHGWGGNFWSPGNSFSTPAAGSQP